MKQIVPILIATLIFSCHTKNEKTKLNEEITNNNPSLTSAIPLKLPTRIKAMTSEISEWDTVSGIFEGYEYVLYPHGQILLINDGVTRTIKLQTQDYISEAHFYFNKDDLIIFYTDTDMDVSASYVECFDKNFQLKWRQNMGGFNLTNPAIIDSISFVASIGFVGKLNMNSGKYFWEHNNLYDTTRFDAFSSITFDGIYVTFNGWQGMNKTGKVVIDDKTGQIIEIK